MLKPQTRYFTDPPTETNEAAIDTFWNGQLYTVIGKPDPSGGWQLRLWWKPFVTLIWAGGALIALGGALALIGRVAARRRRRERRMAQGALRMSRAVRFAPLALFCCSSSALVWRLATPADTTVSSQAGRATGACLRAACRRAAASRRWRRATSRPASRGCSTSSPAGACPASPRRKVLAELEARGVRDRRHRGSRSARGRRRFPRPQRRSRIERIGSDPQSRVQIALGSSGVPESFVVDGKGIIRYQHIGPIERRRRPDDPAKLEQARMKRLACSSLLMLARSPLLADSNLPPAYWADRQLPDPRQEAKAQALMEELRCLVCQGQSIADSDAELAGDMRDLVRRRIAAGEKPDAIRAWLIERYGSWISYGRRPSRPPGRCGWRRLRCCCSARS